MKKIRHKYGPVLFDITLPLYSAAVRGIKRGSHERWNQPMSHWFGGGGSSHPANVSSRWSFIRAGAQAAQVRDAVLYEIWCESVGGVHDCRLGSRVWRRRAGERWGAAGERDWGAVWWRLGAGEELRFVHLNLGEVCFLDHRINGDIMGEMRV
jgi:hypothetical protein